MAVELGQQAEPYTVEDVLEQFGEDERIELLEGTLIVSPFARGRHQLVGDELRVVLRDAGLRGERGDENVYREVARLAAGSAAATDLPFPVELDPADLLR